MTATILDLFDSGRKRVVDRAYVDTSGSVQTKLPLGTQTKSGKQVGTDTLSNINIGPEGQLTENVSIERIYPHTFDVDEAEGQARMHIVRALDDAQRALECFGDADLESMCSRLTLVAATMSKAHEVIEFNESLGAVVSFVRRAILASSSEDVTRPALNSLVNTLQTVSANPMIDLDEACDLTEQLANEGWRGEHGVASALIAAMLDSLSSEEGAEVQKELFGETIDNE